MSAWLASVKDGMRIYLILVLCCCSLFAAATPVTQVVMLGIGYA